MLGRLELALGNLEAAGGYLRELPGRLLAAGLNDPTQPVWADAIETLIALGELEQARAYLEQYEVHAQRLGSPWALAAAARCRGLLAAAEGDLAAPSTRSSAPSPSWKGIRTPSSAAGRCSASAGAQAGAAEAAAREALEQALAIFEELGARCGRRRPVQS